MAVEPLVHLQRGSDFFYNSPKKKVGGGSIFSQWKVISKMESYSKNRGGGYHLFLPLITLSNVIFICVCVSKTQKKNLRTPIVYYCLYVVFVLKWNFFFTIEIAKVLRLPYNNLNRIIILLKCGFHLSWHVAPGNTEEEKCLERFHTFKLSLS